MLRALILLTPLCLLAGALSAQLPAATSAHLTLQPGDLLRVEIWREEDLSGEFMVGESGLVVLPLLGERRVVGEPLGALRDRLISEYREQLRNPAINITPLRRIHVLGEVSKPGLYPVDPTVSLAGAIALAGGATQNGDLNRIRVVHQDGTVTERVAAESTLATVDIRSGDQILVDRRSWFDRNSTFLVSAVLSVTSIVISLINAK